MPFSRRIALRPTPPATPFRIGSSQPSLLCCHPRGEHLLPLHVCLGMADAPAEVIFDDLIVGGCALAFLWQVDA